MDASELLLGQYFRLCVDADGPADGLMVGDAGYEIYVQLLSVHTTVGLGGATAEGRGHGSRLATRSL